MNKKMNKKMNDLCSSRNLTTKDILFLVDYCKENSFFFASSVFVSKDCDSYKICLIYQNFDELRIRTKQLQSPYHIELFVVQNILTLILQRDIRLLSLFTDAIPLRDNANIAYKIYTSLNPISLYNTSLKSEKHYDEVFVSDANQSISMLFCDIENVSLFIGKTLLPICFILRKELINASICIMWYPKFNGTSQTAELTILSDKLNFIDTVDKLQAYLYNNVSELNLGKIILPYNGASYLKSFCSNKVRGYVSTMLCFLSEMLLEKYSINDLSEKERVTYILYYYIIIAKAFYPNKHDFISANQLVLNEMLHESTSFFTRSILDHQVVSTFCEKLLLEYQILSDQLRSDLWNNYAVVLREWEFIDKDPDSLDIYYAAKNISNSIHDQLEYSSGASDSFIEILKMITTCWNIPNYYKAYIPFCVNYIVNYEI